MEAWLRTFVSAVVTNAKNKVTLGMKGKGFPHCSACSRTLSIHTKAPPSAWANSLTFVDVRWAHFDHLLAVNDIYGQLLGHVLKVHSELFGLPQTKVLICVPGNCGH